MPVAEWSEKYETGIDEIDAQHKHLFEAINNLAGCFKEGKAEPGAREALGFLNEYTKEHFDTEEEFMRVGNYPMLSFHQVEHTELLTRVQNLMVKMDEGFLITADVATFVAEWLAHHINEADMGYVQFFREKTSHLQ
jgi:hemerythrin